MRLKLFLIPFLMLALALQLGAQNVSVNGTVLDENNEPVIGAGVLVKGTTDNGVITDIDGHFSMKGLKSSDILVVSCVGMVTQEVAVKPELTIILLTDQEMLDDVIVVAFGQQTKASFTGSAAVVKKEELEKKQLTNVLSGLQGQVAGLQMVNNSGSPTATPSMAIRGFGSINAGTSPLIIVDGSPYDGGWNNLNPNDVESITVLKDAASNALYGARGANGVIMITTKKGKTEDAVVTLSTKWGVNSRATQEYDYITNPAQYYELFYQALYNYNVRDNGLSAYDAHVAANNTLGLPASQGGLGYMVYSVPEGEYLIGTNGKLNPHATLGNRVYSNGKFYTLMPDDWIEEGFRQGLRQEYNLNISGGNSKLNFYGSLGYLSNEGIAYNSDFNRYTARFNADYQAKSWLKVGAQVSYTHSDQNNVGDGDNLFVMISELAPIYPLYLRDEYGNIMTDENGRVYDYGSGENGGSSRPAGLLPARNPLQANELNKDYSVANVTTLNGYADFTPIDGLKITVNGTVTDNEWNNKLKIQPFYGNTASTYPGGYVAKTAYQTFTMNFQQIVNYTKQFGPHNVSVMVGHENYKYNYNYVWGDRENMFSYYGTDELDGAVKVVSNGGTSSDYNTEGYFSRAMYNFNEKYFLSASYRRDASSRFHPDHRWGNFYSVGGAWTVNKEDWFKSSWVDMLKVKMSWGQQGNDSIGDYRYTDTYDITNVDGEVALVQASVGNPDITWETNSNFNAGIEFDILKSKLTGSVEYFRRMTTDMLCYVYVPMSAGYGGSYDNVGDMLNQGVELDLHYTPIRTNDFSWTINFNATHYRNKVVMLNEDNKGYSLDGHPGYINGYYFHGEGLPLHTFRLKKYAGVSATGESQWYMQDETTGETTVTTSSSNATYYNCGTADPDLYGGISTTLTWKGFDLSVNMNYSIGGKAIDYGYSSLMSNPFIGYTGYALHKDLFKAWSETNTDSDIPRFQYAVKDVDTSSAIISDRFLTDASTLTLQTVNIGYTLPKKWVSKMGMSSLRVFVSGDNLYYWSKRRGFDPRGSFWGSTSTTSYSPVRTFTGGLTIQF
jgi:TonB-linked SusC/RagA family outer membrane protein